MSRTPRRSSNCATRRLSLDFGRSSALPAADRTLNRRTILVNAARGVAGVAFLTVTAAACGSPAEPEVDPLQAPYAAAVADAALARAAATAAPPATVPALTQIASERARHAQALGEELARAAGRTTTMSSTAEPISTFMTPL